MSSMMDSFSSASNTFHQSKYSNIQLQENYNFHMLMLIGKKSDF